jgi:peptidyl-prolyl cis-trans isomerase A (cyclophilin A)
MTPLIRKGWEHLGVARRWAGNSGAFIAILSLALICFQHGAIPVAAAPEGPTRVLLETELGNITLEVEKVNAPITAANFLRYVDDGFYDGGEFHRAVRPDNEIRQDAPIQIVQARINPARVSEAFPPIPIETTDVTGLKHLDGTVSMARDVTPERSGPNTATYQFFVCIGDQPSLDREGKRSPDHMGFAAFGRVIDGMDVIRRIQSSKTPQNVSASKFVGPGQSLVPTIKIKRAHRQ